MPDSGGLHANGRNRQQTSRPAFLITIDTEGDNLWASPRTITTRNSAYLGRFQSLSERYDLKPTYLANWEMVNCPVFQDFARDVVARGQGEIGMHLHAWNTPPFDPKVDGDGRFGAYLTDYPEAAMRAKTARLSEELEAKLGQRMVSHRAGRWSFNAVYARILVEQGYLVDCSVTPHVSWKKSRIGDSRGTGGIDYSRFPEQAYLLDLRSVDRPGNSTLLEVPMTILSRPGPAGVEAIRRVAERSRFGRRVMDRFFPSRWWLRPNGRNGKQLLRILEIAEQEGRDYVEFMLHSSELMPGGSPIFATERSIEALYADIEALFRAATGRFEGMTLAAYRDRFLESASDGRKDSGSPSQDAENGKR